MGEGKGESKLPENSFNKLCSGNYFEHIQFEFIFPRRWIPPK